MISGRIAVTTGWLLIALSQWGCISTPLTAGTKPNLRIKDICDKVDAAMVENKWSGRISSCSSTYWHEGGKSVEDRPLIYAEFGDANSKNKTLIFSTLHGDEVTPFYVGFRMVDWLKEFERTAMGRSVHVIVAPLVNPDGFFRKVRTRTNANGVDLNRNLNTKDWNEKAHYYWKTKYKSDKRRNPGPSPASEPETQFQQAMIQKFKPQKILAIHAPLNFLDYDGPSTLSLDKFPKEYVDYCLKLRKNLKAISSGFFPGSLGNYAGQELGIPTLTLELPSARADKAVEYWGKYLAGMRNIIESSVPEFSPLEKK